MSVPVLFLIFNRPDTTQRVFEAIRAARPTRLYVAADGPRNDREGEAELCTEARRIATSVDWPCEVRTLFRATNLGCGEAVSEAISWFFEQQPEGIILEDDCVPHLTFFRYCTEMLERYRDRQEVMAVCGSSYAHKRHSRGRSYTFARLFDPWGWATWRRAWKKYDRHMSQLSQVTEQGVLLRAVGNDTNIEKYWRRIFDNTKAGMDTWDYQWIFSIFSEQGLVIYPSSNLISNIGFLPDATHTVSHYHGMDCLLSCRELEHLDFPLKHPVRFVPNIKVEKEIYKLRFNVYQPNLRSRILRKGLSLIGSLMSEESKGYVDYYRRPELRISWGGPFNGQLGRRAIFHDIMVIVSPALILETGTFRGTTTALLAESGLPVVTIESQPRNYGFARARLRRFPNVDLRLGDSRLELRDALDANKARLGRPIFAYLDAHGNADLPLGEEIRMIFSRCPDAVVMIDDFQVPDDPGYGYDDYGPGQALTPEYIDTAVKDFDLALLYPALPSRDETGARRGCVVLASNHGWARTLAGSDLLRTIPTTETCAARI